MPVTSQHSIASLPVKRYGSALCIGVILFYIAVQLLHGDHGLIGHAIETRKQQQLRQELHDLRAERERIEHRIRLLHGPAIDADLLGEIARRQLPLAAKDEIVLMTK